jgi:hypothetical protein
MPTWCQHSFCRSHFTKFMCQMHFFFCLKRSTSYCFLLIFGWNKFFHQNINWLELQSPLKSCFFWTGFRYSGTLVGGLGVWIMAFYGSYLRNRPDFHLSRFLLLLCQKVNFILLPEVNFILLPEEHLKHQGTIFFCNISDCNFLAVYLEGSLFSASPLEWCN